MPFLCSTVSNFHDNLTSERKIRAREIHEHVKYMSTRDSVDTRPYRKFRKIFTLPPRVCVYLCIAFEGKSANSCFVLASLSPVCLKDAKKIAPVLQETIFFFTNKEPLSLLLLNKRLCTHLKLSEARSRLEDVPTLTPCGSPTSYLSYLHLECPLAL